MQGDFSNADLVQFIESSGKFLIYALSQTMLRNTK
jgi:hypothetical protein